MRILKEPEVRRAEILDAAEGLFRSKGVDETSVNDIIQRAGVAKGSFYWYFKSKEELLDALVKRENDRLIEEIAPIVEDGAMNAIEKLRRILDVHNRKHKDKKEIAECLHNTENAQAHQKHLIQEIRMLAPVLARVVEQGVGEGLFDTRYPGEVVEFMLFSMAFVVNPSAFGWSREAHTSRLRALQDVMEKALAARQGSLEFLNAISEIG